MVRLPIYRGVVRVRKLKLDCTSATDKDPEWEEFTGAHPPLVTAEVWWAANRALDRASKTKKPKKVGGGGKLISPLQGLMRCQYCDYSMTPGHSVGNRCSGIRHRYYRCIRAIKGGSESGCTTGQVSAFALERAVLSVFQLLEANPAMFPRSGIDGETQRRAETRKQLEQDLDQLDREVLMYRKKVENLIDYIRQGGTTLAQEAITASKQDKEKLAQLEAERVRLATAISRLAAKIPLMSEVARHSGLIASALSLATLENQHEIYSGLLKSIWVRRVIMPRNEEKKRSIQRQRVFRLNLNIDSNYLLKFGREHQPMELRAHGYAETSISVIIQIISARGSQRVLFLEQGVSIQSADYSALRTSSNGSEVEQPKEILPQNPIQRAHRWKTQMETNGLSCTQLAESEKPTRQPGESARGEVTLSRADSREKVLPQELPLGSCTGGAVIFFRAKLRYMHGAWKSHLVF